MSIIKFLLFYTIPKKLYIKETKKSDNLGFYYNGWYNKTDSLDFPGSRNLRSGLVDYDVPGSSASTSVVLKTRFPTEVLHKEDWV